MQILCISGSNYCDNPAKRADHVQKGEIYHKTNQYPVEDRVYYSVSERGPMDWYNRELFVELPNQEGQVFSKKELIEA